MSSLDASIQHCIGVLAREIRQEKRNKQHWIGKKRSKTISICRGHDFAYRKSYRNHEKTSRMNKLVQHDCKIQDQDIKINCISIH